MGGVWGGRSFSAAPGTELETAGTISAGKAAFSFEITYKKLNKYWLKMMRYQVTYI